MGNRNLKEIAVLRSIVMLMVITIHFLNLPHVCLQMGSYGQGFYVIWRAMLVCAVPCFMFLSMMMVSYHAKEKEGFDTMKFFKKRIYRIVIPYLTWSMIYLAFYYVVHRYTKEDFAKASNWIYWLGYGKANDHLYFMMIMCQFYLLTPLLYPLAKRYQNSLGIALAMGLLPQVAIYWLNRLYIHQVYPLFTSSFAWYWCIGFLGLWFGFEYEKNIAFFKKHCKVIVALNAISFGIHFFYSNKLWHQLWEKISFDTFPYTVNMYSYMLLCIVSLLLFAMKVSNSEKEGFQNKINGFLNEVSKYSYGIYLMHPLFMFVLRKKLTISNPYLWLPIILVTVPMLAYLCGVITKYGEKLPVVSYAFGVSRKK